MEIEKRVERPPSIPIVGANNMTISNDSVFDIKLNQEMKSITIVSGNVTYNSSHLVPAYRPCLLPGRITQGDVFSDINIRRGMKEEQRNTVWSSRQADLIYNLPRI